MSRLPVAILAGGLATRLGPLTKQTPKCLLEVSGRPFVHHQLRQLRDRGVRRVVLCLGYLGEQVTEAVGDGSAFGLEVAYSFDGPELRGTAGAIRRALPLLGEAFFVLYGDSYLECRYADVQAAFEDAGKLALMTVFHNEGRWDTSNVEFRDGRILAYDKVDRTPAMEYIDYGLGVLDRRAMEVVPESGSCDLATVYQQMLRRGELAGFEVSERFYEIGSVAGLEETRAHLAGRDGLR
jgi:NDP-sugar pyrophosphorylase family protein